MKSMRRSHLLVRNVDSRCFPNGVSSRVVQVHEMESLKRGWKWRVKSGRRESPLEQIVEGGVVVRVGWPG